MKKTLIALALTALPVASMADVILYGQIKGGVEVTKVHGTSGTSTSIVDYSSRIGFKGHEHLTGNLQAIWQLEQSVNIGGVGSTFGTRDSFIGLKGDFGTVKAGYQQTPIKELNGELDQWEYSSDYAGLGKFTRSNDAVARYTAISYETPDMAGFSAKAYVAPSANVKANVKANTSTTSTSTTSTSTTSTSGDRAVYGLSASYKNSGFFADIAGVYVHNGQYNYSNKVPGRNGKYKAGYQALAQLGYEQGPWFVGAAYQRAQNVDEDFDVTNEVALSGAYTVDEALRLKATAAMGYNLRKQNAIKAFGNGKYYQGIVGADYLLSKRTTLNAQVGYAQFGNKRSSDAEANGASRGGTVSVGMKHKF